jgi:hypothetical protein
VAVVEIDLDQPVAVVPGVEDLIARVVAERQLGDEVAF